MTLRQACRALVFFLLLACQMSEYVSCLTSPAVKKKVFVVGGGRLASQTASSMFVNCRRCVTGAHGEHLSFHSIEGESVGKGGRAGLGSSSIDVPSQVCMCTGLLPHKCTWHAQLPMRVSQAAAAVHHHRVETAHRPEEGGREFSTHICTMRIHARDRRCHVPCRAVPPAG